jgi:hypothetical protein
MPKQEISSVYQEMWNSLGDAVPLTAAHREQLGELLCKALADKIDTAAEERLTDYVSKEPSDALKEWAVQCSKHHLATRDYIEFVTELFHRYCTWARANQHLSIWSGEQEDALAKMEKEVKGLRKITGGILSKIREAHDDSQDPCHERVFVPDDPISIEEVQCVERVIEKLIRWRIYDHQSSILDGDEAAYLDHDQNGGPIFPGRAQKQKGPGRSPNTQHNRLVVRLGEVLSCTTLTRAAMARCIEKVLRAYGFHVQSWQAVQLILLKADIPPKGKACIPSKDN